MTPEIQSMLRIRNKGLKDEKINILVSFPFLILEITCFNSIRKLQLFSCLHMKYVCYNHSYFS